MTKQMASERVSEIVQGIRNAQERASQQFTVIGAYLLEVKEQQLFRLWDSTFTFDDFCEDIGIGRTTAYNCMRVVERFGGHDLTGIAFDRLVQLLPLATDDIAPWMEKARDLPARGLRDEIREARQVDGERPIDTCEHQSIKKTCADCGINLG